MCVHLYFNLDDLQAILFYYIFFSRVNLLINGSITTPLHVMVKKQKNFGKRK
ncbi:hypothetical protein HanIR_Chr13g0618511 [Helianthus annuus]|nr:hypothetical protein HanIR_Chr13g0618511 [Helianthus annuus]